MLLYWVRDGIAQTSIQEGPLVTYFASESLSVPALDQVYGLSAPKGSKKGPQNGPKNGTEKGTQNGPQMGSKIWPKGTKRLRKVGSRKGFPKGYHAGRVRSEILLLFTVLQQGRASQKRVILGCLFGTLFDPQVAQMGSQMVPRKLLRK